jgi:hypothetical protein
MKDYTLCTNYQCEKKETCDRYQIEDDGWQSYTRFEAKDCEYYMPVEGQSEEKPPTGKQYVK